MPKSGAWSVTGSAEIRKQIDVLRSAAPEFKKMIDTEMKAITPGIEDTLVWYSDQRKNRITGDMVRALGARYAAGQIRFGFVKAGTKLYQELQTITGFTHLGGKFIEPSFAIKDTREYALKEMREAQRRIRRNFMQRLRRRG